MSAPLVTPESSTVQSAGRVFEFPATPTQSALWCIHQIDPQGTAYNIPLAFDLEGALDVDALRRAFAALVERHEILRTVYVERGDRLMQRVLPVGSLQVDWAHTERALAAGRDPRDEMRGLTTVETRRAFDLSRAGPLRVRLTSFGSERHLLVVVIHHIAVDHAAIGLFAQELSQLYAVFRDGHPAPLAPLELQFADYAVWLRNEALPRTLEHGLTAWLRELEGHSGLLNLPAKLGAARVGAGAQGAMLRFDLPVTLADTVRSFAKSRGLSAFNVLLGGFQAMLHLHTGQRDILVGTPFANRGRDERLEQVMGCFMNTLPVPARVDAAVGFGELLKETRRGLLHAQEFQHVPFDSIVERVKPHREPGLNPLYQVGFVMQAEPVQLRFDGMRSTDLEEHSGGAMYDLHFWISDAEREGPMQGLAWYDTGRFDESDVRALTSRFTCLVGALIADPERALSEFSVATPEEQAQLTTWNDTARAWEPAGTALDLIVTQATATPDAVAVIARSGEFSYAQVVARAADVSRALAAQGVGPGDLVGLSVSRDVGMVVGALGIVGAGAAYVPLDPEYPDDRLAYIARESGLRALITDPGEELRARDRFALDATCAVFAIGGDGAFAAESANTDATAGAFVAPPADGLMYVIFTSGSTGRPKGVAVPHAGVVNFLRSMAAEPGFAASDRLLAVTTLSFDIAVLELFLPLTRGGSVVIADADQVHDGDNLIQLLEQHRVTVMQATPSGWRMLIESRWKGAPHSLRALCGGESLPPSLADELLPRVAELWNLYGPTETTVWSTRERVRAGEPITIGRPIENTALHVLSTGGQPLPSGVPGELFIGGAGVTAGYLGRDDLTRDRFVDTAFGRLYRTGDLVTRLRDGRLLCLGRLDDQVKVNGHRVELGEVERVLEELPAVRQAAVRVSAGNGGDARLVAYIVAEPNSTVFGSELRRALRDRLPDYMVPSIVLPIDALPLTPNGKVDRRALPDPLAGAGTEFVEPRTDAERAVANVWRELLGVERVGVLDNFFEIGGHSLLAIRATARLGDRVGVRPDPRAMFFQTLEQVAASLERQPRAATP